MGTNFYFTDKEIDNFYKSFRPEKSPLYNQLINNGVSFGSPLIHIGKRSVGWKPLFKVNEKLYNSNVEDLLHFYVMNHERLTILDEYLEEYTYNDFLNNFVYWGKEGKEGGELRDNKGNCWTSVEFS